MFFGEEGGIFLSDLLTVHSELDQLRFSLRSVPTHTEDGIPIRKLYVSNLPPKTTRTELFSVFAQYGFIKSCWMKMGERGPNKAPAPTFAFVTYSNPADAHKALQAPSNEKVLRGRSLRISPADSWHQPEEDANGQVKWWPKSKRRSFSGDQNQEEAAGQNEENPAENGEDSSEPTTSNSQEETNSAEDELYEYSIMDTLNRDCLTHVLSYVPVRDLIRSERVSKRWRDIVQEYLEGIRFFKTSSWEHGSVTLTTAILRQVLMRSGPALSRLHIDHHWSALNDRTAHTIGKFCPNLEELKVVGMYTKNWNPIVYGCKVLKDLSFLSCTKLTDASLIPIVNGDSRIQSITVTNNSHVTGLFLTGTNPPHLKSLSFFNCYNLQGAVLCAAIPTIENLTTLRLDLCPAGVWKIVPSILSKLPQLEELSLSEYTSLEACLGSQSDDIVKSFEILKELKKLKLSRNIFVMDAILKQVAQSCKKLISLDASSCNARRGLAHKGVTDDGITAICNACDLQNLDASYLAGLTDKGVYAMSSCQNLQTVTVRGTNTLTSQPFVKLVNSCGDLEELDLCGCNEIGAAIVEAGVKVLEKRPRNLTMRLAGTAVQTIVDLAKHPQLIVDTKNDKSDPHLRPDFIDQMFDDSSDDSDDMWNNPENYEDFLPGSDDEYFFDEDLEGDEYEEAMMHIDFDLHPELLLF